MKNIFAWAGGYPPALLVNEPAEHVEQAAKSGAAVLLATAFAAANWGIGCHAFTAGAPEALRLSAAAIAAVFGAAVVLAVDRGAVYLLDTRGFTPIALLFAAMRVVLILVVSSFTARVTVPVFMHRELEQHAHEMREASDTHRAQALDVRYGLSQHEQSAADSLKQLQQARGDAAQLPSWIAEEKTGAAQCWRQYSLRRQRLSLNGVDLAQLRDILAPYAQACHNRDKQAQGDTVDWRKETDQKIADVQTQHQQDAKALEDANAAVSKRLQSDGVVDAESLVPTSSVVLGDLVATNADARRNWYLFLALTLLIETLPVMTKLLGGRSAMGVRIGVMQEMAALEHQARLSRHADQLNISAGVSRRMAVAMVAAADHLTSDTEMRDYFFAQAKAVAPMEAAVRTMRSTAELQGETQTIIARYPQLGPFLSDLCLMALQDSTDFLTRRAGAAP